MKKTLVAGCLLLTYITTIRWMLKLLCSKILPASSGKISDPLVILYLMLHLHQIAKRYILVGLL